MNPYDYLKMKRQQMGAARMANAGGPPAQQRRPEDMYNRQSYQQPMAQQKQIPVMQESYKPAQSTQAQTQVWGTQQQNQEGDEQQRLRNLAQMVNRSY